MSFVPFQTTFLSNIQLSVMRDSWQGRIQGFIHRSCALRLLNPFTTLRLIIFPPSRPYTSSSSYRNEERLKRKIEMHLSSKLYKPLLYLLVRRKHLGGNPPLGFAPARNDWLIKGIRFCVIIEDPVNVKMHTISFIFHLRLG